MSNIAAERLYSALKGLFEEQADGRVVRVHEVSEPPTFDWKPDGSMVTADFLHRDGATTVLQISAAQFEHMQAEIAEALVQRPRQ